jgi:lipid-binding SYLF domain-containing protein
MFLLNSAEAVRAFSGKGNVSFGAEMGIAAGPLGGRSAGAEIRTADGAEFAPVYSYSHNKGIFAGMSMEGSVVSSREDCNAEFYNTEEGAGHHPEQLLKGEQPAAKPAEAQPLYDALNPGEWPAYSLDTGACCANNQPHQLLTNLPASRVCLCPPCTSVC